MASTIAMAVLIGLMVIGQCSCHVIDVKSVDLLKTREERSLQDCTSCIRTILRWMNCIKDDEPEIELPSFNELPSYNARERAENNLSSSAHPVELNDSSYKAYPCRESQPTPAVVAEQSAREVLNDANFGYNPYREMYTFSQSSPSTGLRPVNSGASLSSGSKIEHPSNERLEQGSPSFILPSARQNEKPQSTKLRRVNIGMSSFTDPKKGNPSNEKLGQINPAFSVSSERIDIEDSNEKTSIENEKQLKNVPLDKNIAHDLNQEEEQRAYDFIDTSKLAGNRLPSSVRSAKRIDFTEEDSTGENRQRSPAISKHGVHTVVQTVKGPEYRSYWKSDISGLDLPNERLWQMNPTFSSSSKHNYENIPIERSEQAMPTNSLSTKHRFVEDPTERLKQVNPAFSSSSKHNYENIPIERSEQAMPTNSLSTKHRFVEDPTESLKQVNPAFSSSSKHNYENVPMQGKSMEDEKQLNEQKDE